MFTVLVRVTNHSVTNAAHFCISALILSASTLLNFHAVSKMFCVHVPMVNSI